MTYPTCDTSILGGHLDIDLPVVWFLRLGTCAQSRTFLYPVNAITQAFKIRKRHAVSWVCFVSISLLTSRVLESAHTRNGSATQLHSPSVFAAIYIRVVVVVIGNDSFEIRPRTK